MRKYRPELRNVKHQKTESSLFFNHIAGENRKTDLNSNQIRLATSALPDYIFRKIQITTVVTYENSFD
ncbi:MAG TPA: hypothetical protein DE060_20535 [Lentisphaeria bacterium]|jgi:hypothetical protein|nr:hypothetical protein [Lentisphaeria bacterium]HCG51579.1 hypothetical protein [Lentisphaeria bacterium]